VQFRLGGLRQAEPHILGGLACYVVSVVVWIMALSRVEVSIAYPMIWSLGIVWIDALITLLIAIHILFRDWQVLLGIVNVLMQTSASLDFEAIRRDICAIKHVRDLHHVHTWMINESTIFFEAHISLDDMPLSMVQTIAERIERMLVDRYGISHVTLQAEVIACEGDSCKI